MRSCKHFVLLTVPTRARLTLLQRYWWSYKSLGCCAVSTARYVRNFRWAWCL